MFRVDQGLKLSFFGGRPCAHIRPCPYPLGNPREKLFLREQTFGFQTGCFARPLKLGEIHMSGEVLPAWID